MLRLLLRFLLRALAINDELLGPTHPTSMKNLEFVRDVARLRKDRQEWEKQYRELIARRAVLAGGAQQPV